MSGRNFSLAREWVCVIERERETDRQTDMRERPTERQRDR